MPIALQTLFCTPQDVWDVLSAEGVDLRLDDHNQATGQIIATTADAAIGATSLAVLPLPVPLLNGAVLTFEGSGGTAPVQVQLTAVGQVNATTLNVQPLTAALANGSQARDSGVNAATAARLLVACRMGTSKVKLYCNKRYDDVQLKLSGTVCDWAKMYAAKFLCSRRSQGVPRGIAADWKDALAEMQMVNNGALDLEDAATRGVDWPAFVNVTVDPSYDCMRARVEPNISEGTPTAYSQYIDWNSAAWIEF